MTNGWRCLYCKGLNGLRFFTCQWCGSLNLVNALIDANKDFDELDLPNRRHGFGNEPYMIRRRWDYFVRNLLGATPPSEYQMHPPAAPGFRRPAAGGADESP